MPRDRGKVTIRGTKTGSRWGINKTSTQKRTRSEGRNTKRKSSGATTRSWNAIRGTENGEGFWGVPGTYVIPGIHRRTLWDVKGLN